MNRFARPQVRSVVRSANLPKADEKLTIAAILAYGKAELAYNCGYSGKGMKKITLKENREDAKMNLDSAMAGIELDKKSAMLKRAVEIKETKRKSPFFIFNKFLEAQELASDLSLYLPA